MLIKFKEPTYDMADSLIISLHSFIVASFKILQMKQDYFIL